MKSKQIKIEVTADELKLAVRNFVKDGGIIQKLPDQKSASHKQVGGKWANTELGGAIT